MRRLASPHPITLPSHARASAIPVRNYVMLPAALEQERKEAAERETDAGAEPQHVAIPPERVT